MNEFTETNFGGRRLVFGCLVAAIASFIPVYCTFAAAPPIVSLVISSVEPVVDEYGVRLKGTDPSSGLFGIPVVTGDLVEVYLAVDGQIFPPDARGYPDARNVLLKTFSVGRGASPIEPNPGMFGCVVSPRPAGGSRIFVRAFNHPTRAQASYYADSELFTVSATVNEPFWVTISGSMRPLDAADFDGDGMINSREISMGTDPNAVDSDGDGLTDHDEVIAGTNPIDYESVLMVESFVPLMSDRFLVSWPTVDGRSYRVERADHPDDSSSYYTVYEGIGNGTIREVVFSLTESESAVFRIVTFMESDPE